MNYSSLEEAYGTPFGQRTQITHERKDVKEASVPKPEFSPMEKKAEESIRKNQGLIDSLQNSLPLDRNPETENFTTQRVSQPVRERVREHFAAVPASSGDDKLSRILRLIEQNKTGYERPAVQDMALYVFTGVFFLFTFDTFVMLGKSMRGK
jgi:hypothetical protein